jgi:hypothetical protein
MKMAIQNTYNKWLLMASLFVALVITTITATAQDAVTTTRTTTTVDNEIDTSGMWYNAPWVWIVGAGVVLLILFLIFRNGGNGSARTTTTSTTITRE